MFAIVAQVEMKKILLTIETLSNKNSTSLPSSETVIVSLSFLFLSDKQQAHAASKVLDRKSQIKYGSNAPNNKFAVFIISVDISFSSLLGEAVFLLSKARDICSLELILIVELFLLE